jgi:hypothetical protein
VVPHLIVQQLLDYVSKIDLRRKPEFIEKLCRYWSLKREARRGAPLLKRLHLEVLFLYFVSEAELIKIALDSIKCWTTTE